MERVLESKENQKPVRKSQMHEDLSMSTISDSSNDEITYGHQNGVFKHDKELHIESGTEYKKQAITRGISDNNFQTSPLSSPGGGSLGGDEFALVVNGHSLVYALGPELELLFLSVAEKCSCK